MKYRPVNGETLKRNQTTEECEATSECNQIEAAIRVIRLGSSDFVVNDSPNGERRSRRGGRQMAEEIEGKNQTKSL